MNDIRIATKASSALAKKRERVKELVKASMITQGYYYNGMEGPPLRVGYGARKNVKA